jgi:hypothetical protein
VARTGPSCCAGAALRCTMLCRAVAVLRCAMLCSAVLVLSSRYAVQTVPSRRPSSAHAQDSCSHVVCVWVRCCWLQTRPVEGHGAGRPMPCACTLCRLRQPGVSATPPPPWTVSFLVHTCKHTAPLRQQPGQWMVDGRGCACGNWPDPSVGLEPCPGPRGGSRRHAALPPHSRGTGSRPPSSCLTCTSAPPPAPELSGCTAPPPTAAWRCWQRQSPCPRSPACPR